ncbi:energy transducer TonB [Pelagicoccus sp. SDUM812003]|uniref:energy transducer TonB n=1 Tax=Pelagicoccus sp. SDUM812003 TaxID=3041267 RepID=UPI00280ED2EC|nr:energy transducer TonB [Pelagicoccus sp. SDUM812003]MDQ8204395.1 hypothetical protein [Pelagicoccus sp. SDUM812003]
MKKPATPILLLLLATASVFSALASANDEDHPARVTRRFEPIYPAGALNQGISQGYAKVLFWVDDLGQPSDFVTVAHNGRWFGPALIDALRDWSFEPKIENGMPVGSVFSVEWTFLPDRAVELNIMSAASKKFDPDEVKELLADPESLESPLALREVYPIYVDKKRKDRVSIDVEFIVDEEGFVRLPRLLSDPQDEGEQLALQRFRKWRFEPPIKDGEATAVSLHKTIVVPVVETPQP